MPPKAKADSEVVSTVVESTAVQVILTCVFAWFFGYLIHLYFDNPIGWTIKWLIYGGAAIGLYLYLCTDFFTEHRIEKENSGTYMHWSVIFCICTAIPSI